MSRDWIETSLRINEKIGDFMVWVGVRTLLLIPAVGIYTWKQLSKASLHLAEMAEKSYSKILIVFDALPYGGMAGQKLIEVEARTISQSFEPITDLLAEIEEKELMILGEKGTGKSTLAQYLAYNLGGQIKVFEPEGTPHDWSGLEVIGKGEDWDSISASMESDLEHISNQMLLRSEKGEAALAGSDRVVIGEEYPEIAEQCDIAEKWLDRHARRGRKARVRLILMSQLDSLKAWKLEGRLELLDCFFRLRLGKKAVKHAKKLGNQQLVEWLKASRSHALLDDDPVILPDYREMQRVIGQMGRGYGMVPPQLPSGYDATSRSSPELPPEAPENRDLQPAEASFFESPNSLLDRVLTAFEEGKSDDWIAKNIYKAQGGNAYYRAKQSIAKIRGKVNA